MLPVASSAFQIQLLLFHSAIKKRVELFIAQRPDHIVFGNFNIYILPHCNGETKI